MHARALTHVDLLIILATCQPNKQFSIHDFAASTSPDDHVREQLLKLSTAKSKPVGDDLALVPRFYE
jgi:hypothetical protein